MIREDIKPNTKSDSDKEDATFDWPFTVAGTKLVRMRDLDEREEKSMYTTEQKQEPAFYCERCNKELAADHVHRGFFDVDDGFAHYFCLSCLRDFLHLTSLELEA